MLVMAASMLGVSSIPVTHSSVLERSSMDIGKADERLLWRISDDSVQFERILLCCLQSLQQKNLELLTVVRRLGAEKENEKATVEAVKEEERKRVEEELSAIRAESARVQVGNFRPGTLLAATLTVDRLAMS
jgi:hypothetical protein